jgi:hypothetical protein
MKINKDDSSKLDNIEKKEIFTAPDNYFEQLQKNVFEQIENEENKPLIPVKKQVFLNPFWMSVAAAISVLLITFLSLRDSVSNLADSNTYALLGGVSSDEIVTYLEQSELSISELEDALKFEDLTDFNTVDTEAFDKYSDDEVDDLYEYYSL